MIFTTSLKNRISPKVAKHLIEVLAPVERAQRGHLQERPEQRGRRHREQQPEHEAVQPGREGGGQIGAHHVERAVGEVDQVHDAEHQGQPGGDQEQHDAELQPVQRLDQDQRRSIGLPASAAPALAPPAHIGAFADVGVRVVLVDRALDPVGEPALPVLHHLAQVEVLDREVVGVEPDRAAGALDLACSRPAISASVSLSRRPWRRRR